MKSRASCDSEFEGLAGAEVRREGEMGAASTSAIDQKDNARAASGGDTADATMLSELSSFQSRGPEELRQAARSVSGGEGKRA